VPPALEDRPASSVKDMTLEELVEWCRSVGERDPENRARQLWRWMYADVRMYGGETFIRGLEETYGRQNGFSEKFAHVMRENGKTVGVPMTVTERHTAKDGTVKLVFTVTGGEMAGGRVETVLIPIPSRKGTRITVCVSSQVGCAMNCQFCFTGRMGLKGNLTTGMIVEQLVEAKRHLAEHDSAFKVSDIKNIVFMGMGEPMDNLPAVTKAVRIMAHDQGLHISRGKITVSTVGLIPEMRQYVADEPQTGLALSLHATTDETRDWIAPVNKRYPIADLVATLEELFPHDMGCARQPLLVEYVMLRGVNDTPEDAVRLGELLRNVKCMVNLIVFNPHEGTLFEPSTPEAVEAFRAELKRQKYLCTVRDSRGDDEMAACGQLGAKEEAGKRLTAIPEWAKGKVRAPAA